MDKEQQPKTYFFETQTKRLKQYYGQRLEQLIEKRIIFNNSVGTVRYIGELKHNGRPENSKGEVWIGLEWDEQGRGKHNGRVNGFEYFRCGEKRGSLVKFEKIQFGYKLETALFKRYFRAEELHHAKNIYESLKELKEQIKDEEEKKKKFQELGKKIHKTEYDSEAYVDTLKKNKRIMVQFIGFDQIWNKINNLDKLQTISLAECRICDLGPKAHLSTLLCNLKILSLEDNLLSNWNQVFQIGMELRQLTQLSLTNNKISPLEVNVEEMKTLEVIGHEQKYDLTEKVIFPKLKCLIVINTGLSWKSLFQVSSSFPQIEELILCKNALNDTENINQEKVNNMKELKFLNLQETNQSSFQGAMKFRHLEKLQKLIINKNPLNWLGDVEGFIGLKHLSIQFCQVENPVVISQISRFFELQSLNIKHNPVGERMGHSHIRMRSVAEVQKLKVINGTTLRKYDRKDYEIYYLRESFKEYFTFKKVPDYDYDYEDFLKYCDQHHPNIPKLIKKYGNPYEVEQKKQIKAIIKEQVKQNEIKKGTGMVQVFIMCKELDTKDKKKVPLSWTLSSLKNLFAKTLKIPAPEQQITYRVDEDSEEEVMGEDHKNLSFYNLKVHSIIYVGRRL